MGDELKQTKLDAMFSRVKDRIQSAEYVEVDPRELSDAMQSTLWYLWHTEPGSVRPKALEMAAGYGLHFQTYMYPGDGRTSIIFTRPDHPWTKWQQRVSA